MTFSVFITLLVSLPFAKTSQLPLQCHLLPSPSLLFTPENSICSSIFIDNTTPSFAPWTSPPLCLIPRSLPPSQRQKFCIYTSTTYNLGAGLSILTTPLVASALTAGVARPLPAYAAKRFLAHNGHLTPEQKSLLPYKVSALPGKGLGVVATKKIPKFSMIMISYPTMIIDDAFLPQEENETPVEGWRAFEKMLNGLPEGDGKERFLSLARSGKEGREEGSVHVVEDLVRNNAFGLWVGERDAKGVFPEVARINHACDANAFPQFISRDLSMRVIATRDIFPNEEITISYIPHGMPTLYRHRSLRNWSFNCTCALCSSSPSARAASDARREQLADLYSRMEAPAISLSQMRELVKQFEEIVDKEELEVKKGMYYNRLMGLFAQKGDWEGALQYGEGSLRYVKIFEDQEGAWAGGLRGDLRYLKGVLGR